MSLQKRGNKVVSKVFVWKHYTVEITKKKIKRINFRIKPSEPQKIYISIPYQVSYDTAMKLLNQEKYVKLFEEYERKHQENSHTAYDWYEEHKHQLKTYAQRLERLLPDMIAKWENVLGVKTEKVSIRDTRSQWGSCNRKTHNISISVWLGAFSEECIEYVVVHELVHLLERGHNERFYGYLDQYYPKWRVCKEKLKELNSEQ